MNTLEQPTIGDYVAKDFRTATLFSKYGIDFCCRGNKTLEEVCEKKGLDSKILEKEINLILETKNNDSVDFNTWPTDLLIDYILKKHHSYIEETSPVILAYLDKLCNVHGGNHPELFEVNTLFKTSSVSLAQHMKKEEGILFPFICEMIVAIKENKSIQQPGFGTIENPIAAMKSEHENEGDVFAKIAELTNNYTPPADACSTYKVALSMLKEFEQDLHKHIHLENNILFHKAIKLQEAFDVF